jgi:hypothetical protein
MAACRRGDPPRERRHVAGLDDERSIEPGDRLRQATATADDRGRSARGRLDDDQPVALERARGHDPHVGSAVEVDQGIVVDTPEQPDALVQAGAPDAFLQLARQWALAGQQQP